MQSFPKDFLLVSRVSKTLELDHNQPQCTSRRTLCSSLEVSRPCVSEQQPAQRTSQRTVCWSLESPDSCGAAQQPASVHFPAGLFAGLSSLQIVVDLERQPASVHFPSELFAGLSRLQTVLLNQQPTSVHFPSGFFSGLSRLQAVWLDHNPPQRTSRRTLCWSLEVSRKCGWTTTSSVHFPKNSLLVSRGSRQCWRCTTTSLSALPE